jgi:hypothetical protein
MTMTRQTAAPLARVPMNTFNRSALELVRQIHAGQLDLNPPYQRGAVWSEDQRVALIFSLMSGLPVPTLILNQRHTDPPYVAIDGKQRLLCVVAWFGDDLAVPASWFPDGLVAATQPTTDGPYVTFGGLTDKGQRSTSRMMLPVGEAMLPDIEAEARVYLLVNGGGTPQTDADMSNATRVAEGN